MIYTTPAANQNADPPSAVSHLLAVATINQRKRLVSSGVRLFKNMEH